MTLTRRSILMRSLALGCAAAASPLITPVSFASAPWDARLVVILLRGGMDGLGVVQPYGDRAFADLRSKPDMEGSVDLDGRFALHPALSPLLPMWRKGELGFAHAVSTPYRDKRSHFDGQDLLEAGTATLTRERDGWLNRLLQVSGVSDPETAYALGRENMLLLAGTAPHYSWTPEANLTLSPQALALAELVMSDDPAFGRALQDALRLAGSDGDSVTPGRTVDDRSGTTGEMSGQGDNRLATHRDLARFAAGRLTGAARVAAFSLNGWDTHKRQDRSLSVALTRLAETLLTLQETLGPIWGKTAVLAMTEFGRTARLNGTGGTDHGTGGAMLFAGGALNGGQVVADWPGIAEQDLYQSRDLMPTRDIRAHAAWTMRDLFGLSITDLETTVFPGLDMGARSSILL